MSTVYVDNNGILQTVTTETFQNRWNLLIGSKGTVDIRDIVDANHVFDSSMNLEHHINLVLNELVRDRKYSDEQIEALIQLVRTEIDNLPQKYKNSRYLHIINKLIQQTELAYYKGQVAEVASNFA